MRSHYLVEVALYGGVFGFTLLLVSCAVGFAGLGIYLLFGW